MFLGYRFVVTRKDWIAIAEVLAAQRATIETNWSPKCDLKDAAALHDRKLVYFAKIEAFERTAMLLAAALDKLCPSFDRRRFLKIISLSG